MTRKRHTQEISHSGRRRDPIEGPHATPRANSGSIYRRYPTLGVTRSRVASQVARKGRAYEGSHSVRKRDRTKGWPHTADQSCAEIMTLLADFRGLLTPRRTMGPGYKSGGPERRGDLGMCSVGTRGTVWGSEGTATQQPRTTRLELTNTTRRTECGNRACEHSRAEAPSKLRGTAL